MWTARPTLHRQIDGIFKMMLLLKKKKYAALTVVQDAKGKVIGTEKETKGLDLVRRDWCVMSKEVGNKVLDIILSGEPCETVVDSIHSLMRELADNVRNDKMALVRKDILRAASGLGVAVLTHCPCRFPSAALLRHHQGHLQGTP